MNADLASLNLNQLQERLNACDQRIAEANAEKEAIARAREQLLVAASAEQLLSGLSPTQIDAVARVATLQVGARAQEAQS